MPNIICAVKSSYTPVPACQPSPSSLAVQTIISEYAFAGKEKKSNITKMNH